MILILFQILEINTDTILRAMGVCSSTWTKSIANRPDGSGRTPLMRAAEDNNQTRVLQLIQAGADVNKQDGSGWTPLVHAVTCNRKEIVSTLIQAGADVNFQVRLEPNRQM